MKRIGILGGSFDPPHLAHLVLAASAHRSLDLDQVWFVPAGRPPHKNSKNRTPPETRLKLVRMALRGIPEFRVSAVEVDRRGPSFTVDTMEHFVGRAARNEWWLLVGGDMLADLPNWRRPERLLELASVGVMVRPGHPVRWPRALPRARHARIDAPRLEVSSSEIRERVRRGASIRYLVPEPVERYIDRHGLYR